MAVNPSSSARAGKGPPGTPRLCRETVAGTESHRPEREQGACVGGLAGPGGTRVRHWPCPLYQALRPHASGQRWAPRTPPCMGLLRELGPADLTLSQVTH